MDWKQILSLPYDELTDLKRDEIYEDLLVLNRDNLDRKYHKKMIDLMKHILKYKGDMVSTLLSELEGISSKDVQQINIDEMLETNAKQREIIDRLETDKSKLKSRIKELSEDNVLLHRRNQESSTIGSEREDSPNLLSDLDKQEELLVQIDQKNKQIRRLLRDIETLEIENHSSRHKMQLLEQSLKEATNSVSVITSQLEGYQAKLSQQNEVIEGLNLSVNNLTDQVGVMEKERAEREIDIQVFGTRLEERALRWRQLLQEKDDRLDSLRNKYEIVLEQNPGYDIDSDREGLKQLTEAVNARDHYIADLEEKISDLSKDMTDTTMLLNRLAKEREPVAIIEENAKSICTFCNDMKSKTDMLSERFASLQDIVHSLEEDNVLKSKQALNAQKALALFESGEDGLTQALARNVELQSKIDSRDKHIRSLIVELNNMQTCTHENEILRNRLGITDEEFVSTTALSSKQRKQDKHTKRLELKLRASEEIRLQLKLDNYGLRQQLACLNKTKNINEDQELNLLDSQTPPDQEFTTNAMIKNDDLKESDTKSLSALKEHELRYAVIVEENENLRIGMHEILEQLRNYDAQADHIVIDTPTLVKLLHALDARSISGWYHPAMRMQNELIAAKEREVALIERIRLSDDTRPVMHNLETNQKELQNVEEITNVTESSNKSLDNILQQMSQQDTEINALRADLQRVRNDLLESVLQRDQLESIEKQFEDLTNLLDSDQNDQICKMSALSKTMVQMQINCNREEQKHKFIQEDYDQLEHLYSTQIEMKSRLIFELRKTLLELENGAATKSSNIKSGEGFIPDNIKYELASLKSTISRICASALVAFVNVDEIKQTELSALNNIGVIQADSTLEFITNLELKNLFRKCEDLTNKNMELKSANDHLEELLSLFQSQIESNKQIRNKRNEEEIAIKHLIVDLQSESQEKYIIAKMARDLKKAADTEDELNLNIQELKSDLQKHEQTITDMVEEKMRAKEIFETAQLQNDIKLRFLSKSYADLRQNFHEIVPLYPVLDFMKDYADLLRTRKELRQKSLIDDRYTSEHTISVICEKVEKTLGQSNLEDKLLIIKYESHQAYLEEKIQRTTNSLEAVYEELDQLKLRSADWSQHWNTINLLFGQNNNQKPCKDTSSKETQANIIKLDKSTNTDEFEIDTTQHNDQQTPIPTAAPRRILTTFPTPSQEDLSLSSQLKQAMYLASARSALLLEHESRLAIAHARVKTLEKIIEERDKMQPISTDDCEPKLCQNDENILSATISSLQNLLQEKDASLNKYQEMLQKERQSVMSVNDEHCREIKDLRENVEVLQTQISLKDKELNDFKMNKNAAELEQLNEVNIETQSMPDTMLEEMFLEDRNEPLYMFNSSAEVSQLQRRLQEAEDETRMLHNKLREVSLRETVWERNIVQKDNEITDLNDRIHRMEKQDSNHGTNRQTIDQLQEMLDEKDRHINDLTETLTHFHDDQQKFMNDTTLHSAEQVSQLSIDLNRYETTNRILNTQLDALKRQLANVGQRESQAREVIKTLKTQLIRRPVISLKTIDRSTTNREEQLQKRIQQLDNDLKITREELRKQTVAVQYKRSKDATELDLWSKQKRFQQMADTLKQRLVERENELDKANGQLASAKSFIARLEREKNTLNDRLNRNSQQQQYCNHASCPSLHLSSAKRTLNESPDSYSVPSNPHDCQQSALMMAQLSIPDSSRSRLTLNQCDISDHNQDIVDAQRNRIETQQRKILAMEIEGRGGSAMSQEIERLQEKLSTVEAQNIRLEAKNLHLQLNNDMMLQSDQSEKDKRQIKHLEDYIIALKSELVQTQSNLNVDKRATAGPNVGHTKQMEQTIIAMRRVMERLKAENKNYKDLKTQPNKEAYEKLREDFGKVQQSYSEALDKISALQIELEIQTGQCANCNNRIDKSDESRNKNNGQNETSVDWCDMKEKLIKKSQLLEKAKILLSRAAAKEKQFREQITHWKRRCSELQNVPIIEEESSI